MTDTVPNNTYGKVSGTWEKAQSAYVKVSGVWQEVDEIYAKRFGDWKLVFISFAATPYVTLSGGSSGTFTVPIGANAIHIQSAVAGGGGAAGGADYDKAGGESAGAGGGSGAYISDKVATVFDGILYSYEIGTGGAPGNQTSNYNQPRVASAGTHTKLIDESTAFRFPLFDLYPGGGSSGTGGGVQGPLRTNTRGSAGPNWESFVHFTTGTFKDTDGIMKSVTTLTDGPVGVFNQMGTGAVGELSGTGNCGGDNCSIAGFNGGASYAGNIAGGSGGSIGSAGSAGTRGSGGGGGSASPTAYNGAAGGAGEIKYRFLRVFD